MVYYRGKMLNTVSEPFFPDDENGDVLRRMLEGGDDLSRPRIVDFCFIFPEREQAISFAENIDDPDLKVCISFFEGRGMWQVKVRRKMIPEHLQITVLELKLAAHAKIVGGDADGWGCMIVAKSQWETPPAPLQ